MSAKPSRPEQLRKKAADERRKAQEIERLLARLEARLIESGGHDNNKQTGKDDGDDRRTFPRQPADMVIRYRWPGRHAPMVGRVRDISRGGMRFNAARKLLPGQILQATLHSPSGPGPNAGGQVYLEVVHCRKNNDIWDIGTRFAPTPVEQFRGNERRRARRYTVDLDVSCRVSGLENSPETKGRARDISRSGLRFYCEERLRKGSLAAVVISGVGEGSVLGAGTQIRVSALIRIIRCRRVGSHYEIGAQFVG